MKHVLGFLLVFMTACGSGGKDAATTSAAPDPSQSPANVIAPTPTPTPTFGWSGNYNRELDSATSSCPDCIKTCGQDLTTGVWSCAYASASLPAACTMTLLGSFNLDSAGDTAETAGFYMIQYGHTKAGAPWIDWTNGTQPQPITNAGDTISFSNYGYSITLGNVSANEVAVSFGPGCVLGFTKN